MYKYISFFIFMIYTLLLPGQSLIEVKYFLEQEEFSHKNTLFLQDKNGYIWMGTWNGLERFDGYSLNNYKTYPDNNIRISNHRFTNITLNSHNNIWCITYENQCFLFNTQTHQYEDPFNCISNPQIRISKIYNLPQGTTWAIGLNKYLYRLSNEKQLTTYKQSLFGDSIYDIYQDSQGNEWILSNKEGTIIKATSTIKVRPIQFIAETKTGRYVADIFGYFGKHNSNASFTHLLQLDTPIIGLKSINNNRIAILQPQNLIIYNTTNNQFHQYIIPIEINSSIYQDSHNNLWMLGKKNGVIYINTQKHIVTLLEYPPLNYQPLDPLSIFIHEDNYGCIWIKPFNGELLYYNATIQKLEPAYIYKNGEKQIFTPQISNCFIDRHRNLWYNSNNKLAYLSFHKKDWTYITNKEKQIARALFEDHEKRLWVGWKRNDKEQNGKISIYDSLFNWIGNLSITGKIIKDKNISFNSDVYCIYEDNDSNIWIGTRGNGLFLLQPTRNNSEYEISHFLSNPKNPYSISSNSIYSILQDSHGHIWIGTFGGGLNIAQWKQKYSDIQFIHPRNKLKQYPLTNEKIRCLYESQNGIMLAGTTGGLLVFSPRFDQPSTIKFYTNICSKCPSSLSNNDVFNIMQTRKGSLYITTQGNGVNVLEEECKLSSNLKFKHLNATNSTIPDWSLATIEDINGNIWVCAENKLLKYNSQMQLLNEYNNNILMAESQPLAYSSGEILFGSHYGILCMLPSHIQTINPNPSIVFTNLEIFSNNNPRPINISTHEKIEFSPHERNFKIEFSALNFENPEIIQYAYRIIGLNEQ